MNSIFFPAGARICFYLFLLLAIAMDENGASRVDQAHDNHKEGEPAEAGMEVYPTGSSLPDCTHACGGCFPCKRVTVSFKCSTAESCPVVYRCMCRGKYYPVPSN